MKAKNYLIFLILAVLLAVFFLRFIHLGADPPPNLSNSMGYIGDPGGYAFNARNKLTLGQWEIDQWNIMYVSPLPHNVTYAFFSLFGPGIASMNLVPVFFSCLILIVTFILLRKSFDLLFSLLGTLLLGINYQFLMFSRIAVRVMPTVFFLLLALFFLERKDRRNLFVFLAGISCFISFTVKGTALQFIPTVVIGLALYLYIQYGLSLKKTMSPILLFISGIAAVFALWLIFYYFPHNDMFSSYGGENISWLTPHGFQDALNNFWNRPIFFFQEMPVISILSTLYILSVSFKAFVSSRKITIVEWICILWIISNSLYFAVINYHAARHFVALVPPLVFLSLFFLRDISRIKYIQKPERLSILSCFSFPLLLIFPVSGIFRFLPLPSNLQEVKAKSLLTLGISLFITLLFFLLFKFWPRHLRIRVSKLQRIAAISILIALSVFFNGKKFYDWASTPRFDVRDISRDLGKVFDHMVIAGLLAPVISLENTHEAHPFRSGYINPYPDFLQRFSISHLFVTIHAGEIEKRDYEHNFPEIMQKIRLLARYPIGFTYAELYELESSLASPAEERDIYEGEVFFGKNGIPRYDPIASGKLAFLAEKNKRSFSFDLPLQEYGNGDYTADFRLKATHLEFEDDIPLVRLSVLDSKRNRIIATKDLSSRDLNDPKLYKDFVLPFHLKNPSPLYLRIHSSGKSRIWFDKVTVKTK